MPILGDPIRGVRAPGYARFSRSGERLSIVFLCFVRGSGGVLYAAVDKPSAFVE